MSAPTPNTPARLAGSFMPGVFAPDPKAVINDLLRRTEATTDLGEQQHQAQRVIGALMAFTAIRAPEMGGALYHREVFSRLASITGLSQAELVTCAGVVR